MVVPSKWVAAIPVDAVMETGILLSFRYLIYLFNTKVLPVPADPVKKMFLPDFNIANAFS